MLTASEVKNARPKASDYKISDANGLYLFVAKSGTKSWRYKYRYGMRERVQTFGKFPEVGLADARKRRDKARQLLREGKDPITEAERERRAQIAAAGATFAIVAEEWMADHRPRWSPAHADRVQNRLRNDIYPRLGKLPIGDVTGSMVLRELRKIEARGSIETAKRVKGYIVAIFRRAKAEHLIKADAVMDVADIGDALKPTPKGAKQPALTSLPQLLELQRDIDRSRSHATTRLASRLLALTVVRIGVLRTAPWSEFEGIDWNEPRLAAPEAIWRISAERMKLEVEDKGNDAFGHDVPLPAQAVEVLRALRIWTGRYDLLFPSAKRWRVPISDSAVSSMYKRVCGSKYKGRMVPHGWRSSFSTIMNERAAELERDGDRMIIDMMLAHVPEGMSASEWAYNRARYLKPRRTLGQVWADLITDGLDDPMVTLGQSGTR